MRRSDAVNGSSSVQIAIANGPRPTPCDHVEDHGWHNHDSPPMDPMPFLAPEVQQMGRDPDSLFGLSDLAGHKEDVTSAAAPSTQNHI